MCARAIEQRLTTHFDTNLGELLRRVCSAEMPLADLRCHVLHAFSVHATRAVRTICHAITKASRVCRQLPLEPIGCHQLRRREFGCCGWRCGRRLRLHIRARARSFGRLHSLEMCRRLLGAAPLQRGGPRPATWIHPQPRQARGPSTASASPLVRPDLSHATSPRMSPRRVICHSTQHSALRGARHKTTVVPTGPSVSRAVAHRPLELHCSLLDSLVTIWQRGGASDETSYRASSGAAHALEGRFECALRPPDGTPGPGGGRLAM
eukprot:5713568-Prymnesium_polylepis.1